MTKALILVGGKSTRMGMDKYLLDVHGKPQYQHLYQLAEKMELQIYLSCTEAQGAKIPRRYQRIVDRYDSVGPIGGIVSAIETDNQTNWLVIACDLIHLKPAALRKLLDHQDQNADVITYKKKGADYYETTLALYKPSAFPFIQTAVASGEYSLQKVLKKCKVLDLEAENEVWLKNANRPGELESW